MATPSMLSLTPNNTTATPSMLSLTPNDTLANDFYDGLVIGLIFLLECSVLELLSLRTVKAVRCTTQTARKLQRLLF